MSELSDLIQIHYDGINNNDLDKAMSVFSDDVETSTPMGSTVGIEPFRAFGEAFAVAAPDGNLTATRIIESGNTIVVEGTFSGTQTGELAGPGMTVPPTGKSFSFTFADILEARDGKFVTHHIYFDNAGFMAQLGLMG